MDIKRRKPESKNLIQPELKSKIPGDSIILLQLFPEEIWLKILNDVTEADVLENLCISSLYFRKFFLSNRVEFLFASVYPSLAPHLEDPGTLHMALLQSVLKLRVVCKSWCHGVDRFHQNLPLEYAVREQASKEDLTGKPCYHENNVIGIVPTEQFIDDHPEELQEFLRFFEKTHGSGKRNRSPFVRRAVYINFENGSSFSGFGNPFGLNDEDVLDNEQELELLTNLGVSYVLEKYGHHVWYCSMNLTDMSDKKACYSKLRDVLRLLPNLRVLNIFYAKETWENSYLINNENSDFEEEITGVSEFPMLEKLEFVKTNNLPVQIFNNLIRKNAHVSMLQIQGSNHIIGNYNIYNFPMQNLTKLYIQCHTERDFQKLTNLSVDWPLVALYLDFVNSQFIDWQEIFDVLNTKWGNTLTDMMINLPRAVGIEQEIKIIRDFSTYQINMQKLKRLKLKISNYSNLDFVLPLKDTLEILDVQWMHCDFNFWWNESLGQEVSESARLSLLEWDLIQPDEMLPEKTNVWEMLPKLKLYKTCVPGLGEVVKRREISFTV